MRSAPLLSIFARPSPQVMSKFWSKLPADAAIRKLERSKKVAILIEAKLCEAMVLGFRILKEREREREYRKCVGEVHGSGEGIYIYKYCLECCMGEARDHSVGFKVVEKKCPV